MSETSSTLQSKVGENALSHTSESLTKPDICAVSPETKVVSNSMPAAPGHRSAAPGQRFIRVNLMLTPETIEFLDRCAARSARETGTPVLSRSAMIRGLVLGFEGSGIHGFRSE